MEKMEIELLQEHEDAGWIYPAGVTLELDAIAARRLIADGRARSLAIESQRKTKSKQED